jgi:hypothetical protein
MRLHEKFVEIPLEPDLAYPQAEAEALQCRQLSAI